MNGNWLRHLFSRRRRYQDLSVSIQEHLEENIDELMEQGMSHQQARDAARRAFGNSTLIEQHSREQWQWAPLEALRLDLKVCPEAVDQASGLRSHRYRYAGARYWSKRRGLQCAQHTHYVP